MEAAHRHRRWFFRIGPDTINLSVFGASLSTNYDLEATSLAADPLFDLDELIEQAIRDIYRDQNMVISERLFEFYAKRLTGAIEDGYVDLEDVEEAVANKASLRENIAIFAALKSYHEKSDMAKAMRKDDGSLKSFAEFRKDALKINETYRGVWLRTEYDTTRRSAAMASKWQDMWSKREALPYAQYLPSRATEPREAHKKYYYKVYRLDDPVLDTIFPPNGYGCLCGIRQLREIPEGLTLTITLDADIPGEFRNNPGKTGKVFTDAHAYTKGVPHDIRQQIIDYGKRYSQAQG